MNGIKSLNHVHFMIDILLEIWHEIESNFLFKSECFWLISEIGPLFESLEGKIINAIAIFSL